MPVKAEKKRTIDIEKKQIAEELRKIQKNKENAEIKPLAQMVNATIDLCTANYLDEEERKRKERERAKNAIAYEYIVIVKHLQEMQDLASRYGGHPYADSVKKMTNKFLPEVLKAMSDQENKLAEQKVRDMNIEEEDNMIKVYQNELGKVDKELIVEEGEAARKDESSQDPNKTATSSQKPRSFAQKKADVADSIANILAVQLISNNIKSLAVGMEDMENEGVGEALTGDEIKALTESMLSDENVKSCANMIKERDDFNKMMMGITSEQELDILKAKALDGSGKQIKDELFKAGQELIKADMAAEYAKQQLIEAQVNKELVPDGPVLRPSNDFDS